MLISKRNAPFITNISAMVRFPAPCITA